MNHGNASVAGGITLVLAAAGFGGAAAAASCESLSEVTLPRAEITVAETVHAGAFRIPGGNSGSGPAFPVRVFEALPEFCRVTVTARPTSDSDIKIEVWLPKANWNGKLLSVGNGAWAGSISYTALADAVADNYAAASTDTGHAGNVVTFAVGHPEKLIDFAHRSVHEMTAVAKAIIAARYESRPEASACCPGSVR
jgi:hypothetical protein